VTAQQRAVAMLAGMGEAELLNAERITGERLSAAYDAGRAEEAADIATARGWILNALEDVMGTDRFWAWIEEA
jgi:hypothetical protein